MKQLLRNCLVILFTAFLATGLIPVFAQSSVFNPNDPVVNYSSSQPPTKPVKGQVGKWVRMPKVSFSTTSFKAYIYNDLPFRLKYPKNYDPAKSYPIIVFFHGIGEYGETPYDNEYQLYLGGQKHASAIDNGIFNGFLLYPQSQQAFWSSGSLGEVNNLVNNIMVPQLNVDPFRIFVNGLSAGGQTTWNFLINFPKTVAAITPISAAFETYANSVQKFKYTPIFHFQGALDPEPTPVTSRRLGNAILNAGGNYKYKEYPTLGHSAWNAAWADADYFAFYNRAHKANPWPANGRSEFCTGETINTTIGVTAGFEGYEWRRDGNLIPGANSNELVVTQTGTYSCRILRGTTWSVWSPAPVVIKIKAPVVQPTIKVSGLASRHLPAPDGSSSVLLEVNSGYLTHNWQKQNDPTLLSTTRFLTATEVGNYILQVTDQFSCQKNTIKIDAEDYAAMSGVTQQVTSDIGYGLKVSTIDLNDYMDFSVNIPESANYTFTARVASATGGQFQLKDANDNVFTTVNVPNTGGSEVWKEVNAAVFLNAGLQTLRIQSSASPRWDLNYIQFTGTNNGNFSNVFTVVNANGSNAPDPVSDLAAQSLSKNSVQVTWKQVVSPTYNETNFEVYQASGTASSPYKLVAITAANATSATINSLTAGTEYFYKVRAINNTAASAVSGAVSVVTQADVTPPSTPLNLRFSSSNKNSVRLYWDASTDDVKVVQYDMYIDGVKAYATTATNMYVYHLAPNTTYTFTVKARDLANNTSAFSNAVTSKTPTGTITADPSMLPANPRNHSVYLNLNLENPAGNPWNNMNVLPSADDVTGNLKTYAGVYSGITMTIVENFSGYNAGGMNTGNNSGVYPDNVIRSAYYNDKGNVAKLKIAGLSLRHKYSFTFFGSRNGDGNRTAIYTINNQNVSLNASFNTTNTVAIDNIIADENGIVYLEMALAPGATFAYLNSLVIKGTYLEGATISNQTPIVNAGTDKNINLPTNNVSLTGSAVDNDGTITSYKWQRISGPASFSINNTSASDPVISNLEEGTYIFRLTATDNEGGTAFDDVQVIVNAAPPPPGSRFLNVNLYGGTNPYNNAAWNNWNVSGSLNSGALMYSEGSSSTISAAISKHILSDNGATYGGTMAPPEVLRYTSYGTATRTLTFSGLTTSKTYNLVLFASRNNTGNSTVFTINGTSLTVLTDKNKTDKVVFSNITSDAAGKLVVTIANLNAYNYLNGFVLTELGQYPGAPTVSAGPSKQINLPTNDVTLTGSASDEDGTITNYSWSKISGPSQFSISNPGAPSTNVSNLVQGSYVFRLTATDNDGYKAFKDVEVVVNPAPPAPGTKSLNVNVFGGTNPYANAEWNNWNVTGSLNSGSLKYTNGTSSGISAVLSKSSGINDNAATYGGGMAPAEVLRYASNATTSRTLTFNGLYVNGTYSIELYGSRDNYNGNHTVYTVNGVAQSISTYRNFTNKAIFYNISPNAQGQIVVTISNPQTYNYLNGFTITETIPETQNTTALPLSGSELMMSSVVPVTNNVGFSVNAYPNPSINSFNIRLMGDGTNELLRLRVWDAAGRIVEQRQNIVAASNLLIGTTYQSGVYYLEVTQGKNKGVSKLIKNSN